MCGCGTSSSLFLYRAIYLVKVYIIAAFMLPYIIFLLMRLIRRVQSRYFRRIIMPVLLGLMVFGYIVYSDEIDQLLGSYAIEKLFDSVRSSSNHILRQEMRNPVRCTAWAILNPLSADL